MSLGVGKVPEEKDSQVNGEVGLEARAGPSQKQPLEYSVMEALGTVNASCQSSVKLDNMLMEWCESDTVGYAEDSSCLGIKGKDGRSDKDKVALDANADLFLGLMGQGSVSAERSLPGFGQPNHSIGYGLNERMGSDRPGKLVTRRGRRVGESDMREASRFHPYLTHGGGFVSMNGATKVGVLSSNVISAEAGCQPRRE
ncbi:hypothetical protein QQ045_010372 [Rhodiola kirilowii]